jgi:hypothetical protein
MNKTDKVDTTGSAIAAELNDSLASSYMLATLKISRWSASKSDKELAAKIAEQHGAVEGAASASKKLMVGASEELDNVNKQLNAIRTHLYENTLPWSSDSKDLKGPRIVSTSRSIELLKELGKMQKDFDRSLKGFLKVYADRRRQALTNLGKLGDTTAYPTEAEMAGLFVVNLELVPVPTVSGFGKMNVPAPLAQALAKRMVGKQQKVVDNMMGALQERVLETVTNLSTQLHKSADGEGTRMFDSLTENLKPIVGLIDSAALAKDKRLLGLKKDIEALSNVSIKQVKKATPAAKRKIADKADKVVKTLSKPPVKVTDDAVSEVLF